MREFVFIWPWGLILLVGMLPLHRLLQRARVQRTTLVQKMGGDVEAHRARKDHWRLLGTFLLILALARPGYDPQRLFVGSVGRDVVFILDVSQSMLAQDTVPSRLEVAKQGVRDALERFQSERVGLVIYAGSANILCPLTQDYDFVRYMLEQATPRSVDFGGTQLQAAIEKAVGQVLLEGRAGFQDLVLLTDGEDHGEDLAPIGDMLVEAEAGLLILGLGDAERGARIPQVNEEGQAIWLEHQGRAVETRLNRDVLQNLSRVYRDAVYIEAGTHPFDLGRYYRDYAQARPVGTLDETGEAVWVYRELGFVFMLLGLLAFWMAEFSVRRFRFNRKLIAGGLSLLVLPTLYARNHSFTSDFKMALQLQKSAQYSEAIVAYQEMVVQYRNLNPQDAAVVQFNQGLCHGSLALAAEEQSTREALAEVQQAQACYLHAKRLQPHFYRAGLRLDRVAKQIQSYQAKIQEEDEKQSQLQEQLQALLEQLQVLVDDQKSLRTEIPDLTRRQPSRQNNRQPAPKPQLPPPIPEPQVIAQWPSTQAGLSQRGQDIETQMVTLDKKMMVSVPGLPPMESFLQEPIRLMTLAIAHQHQSQPYLTKQDEWLLARREMGSAITLMEQILEMMASDNSSDEEEWDEDWDMDEYDWEYDEDADNAMSSSQDMQGDLSQNSDMQPLPVPNYSVEDILAEEAENQQFREKKRSKTNAGKVEKDW